MLRIQVVITRLLNWVQIKFPISWIAWIRCQYPNPIVAISILYVYWPNEVIAKINWSDLPNQLLWWRNDLPIIDIEVEIIHLVLNNKPGFLVTDHTPQLVVGTVDIIDIGRKFALKTHPALYACCLPSNQGLFAGSWCRRECILLAAERLGRATWWALGTRRWEGPCLGLRWRRGRKGVKEGRKAWSLENCLIFVVFVGFLGFEENYISIFLKKGDYVIWNSNWLGSGPIKKSHLFLNFFWGNFREKKSWKCERHREMKKQTGATLKKTYQNSKNLL